MIDDPRLFIKLNPVEKALKYNDVLQLCVEIDKDDNIILYSRFAIQNGMLLKEFFRHNETLYLNSNMLYRDNLNLTYKDYIHLSVNEKLPNDYFIVEDTPHESKVIQTIDINDEFYARIKQMSNTIPLSDNTEIEYSDSLVMQQNTLGKDRLCVRDWVKVLRED
jgi:hypothetical protein